MMELWSKGLLLKSGPYKKDQVIFESSTPGTYNVEILGKGKYEVYCIGGGGGGYYKRDNRIVAGGGSGSGFIGIIKIEASTISVSIGAGGRYQSYDGAGSSIGNLVITYGGGRGSTSSAAGAQPTINATIISTTLNSAGNPGERRAGSGPAAGGASLYNGYGAGGVGQMGINYSGVSGYVKIVYKGK